MVRFLLSIISLLCGHSVLAFGLGYCLAHREVVSLGLLFVGQFVIWGCTHLLAIRISVKDLRELLDQLSEPNVGNVQFEELSDQDLVASILSTMTDLRYDEKANRRHDPRYLSKHILWAGQPQRERIRLVIRIFKSPPYDFVMRAYPTFFGTSIVLIQDHPGDMSPFNRFKFYMSLLMYCRVSVEPFVDVSLTY